MTEQLDSGAKREGGVLPIRLSDATGVPFYRQVVDQVAELIGSGQLPAGSRLPSVRELSKHLLVSLITIRRSYADLEAAGLILRRQGQGTFVAEDVTSASRKRSLSEARNLLAESIARARQLGLDGEALRKTIEPLLSDRREPGEGESR
jgi:GntR family transcriptional regulator